MQEQKQVSALDWTYDELYGTLFCDFVIAKNFHKMSTYLSVITELPDIFFLSRCLVFVMSNIFVCFLETLETLSWHFAIIWAMLSGFIYCDVQLIV